MAKQKKDKAKSPPHEKPVKIPLPFKDALKGLLATTPEAIEKAEKEHQAKQKSDS